VKPTQLTWRPPCLTGNTDRGRRAESPNDDIQLNAFPLVFGGRSIYGSLDGTAIDTGDTLAFSVQENSRPMIETRPLEQAAECIRSHDRNCRSCSLRTRGS
jgi:D-arabinose 1-dehydrogenase-like Zn-dependent alcohol dehydrogenase